MSKINKVLNELSPVNEAIYNVDRIADLVTRLFFGYSRPESDLDDDLDRTISEIKDIFPLKDYQLNKLDLENFDYSEEQLFNSFFKDIKKVLQKHLVKK